jgi:outer membrane lipoprotein carrier protein
VGIPYVLAFAAPSAYTPGGLQEVLLRRFLASLPNRVVLLCGVGVTVLMLMASPVATASGQATPDSAAQVMAGFKATYQGVQSIRADFSQTVSNAAMGPSMQQLGKIALERPRKLRIEVGTPTESVVVSDGKTMWVYSVASKSVTETPVLAGGDDIGAVLEDLGKIDALFDVTLLQDQPAKATQTLALSPRKAGQVKSLQLSLMRSKFTLTELLLVDQFDTTTSMSFTNMKLNQDLPDSDFTFKAPAGVQVIKNGSK